jgi:hypothetical protein
MDEVLRIALERELTALPVTAPQPGVDIAASGEEIVAH